MRSTQGMARAFLPLLMGFTLFAVGCKGHRADVLRVGVTPGPAEEILRSVEPDLAKRGLQLQIIPFSDYVQPNLALASHDVDANLYQNTVFLNQFNQDHQTRFVPLCKVYLPLMAIYPGRVKILAALSNNSRIAIPNDPVNHDRALLLLEQAGLIGLDHRPGEALKQVVSNRKQIKLVELDAAQLPRSLDDVDAAVINANFALDAGLNPATNALFVETRTSPYANVLAVNQESSTDPHLLVLQSALTSPQVGAMITAHYRGAIYPAE
jgi:D-methionine transport system substrate-binding protein